MRGLRCAWCSFAVLDNAPPLPFLPKEECNVIVFACCWQCGSKFNVIGGSLRGRQVNALFYSTHPAQAYTNEQARAVFAYVVRLISLSEKRVEACGTKAEAGVYRKKEKQQFRLRAKARERLAMYQRAVAEAFAEHEKLRKIYGEMPDDMFDKTFAELEIIIFGNASPEAHAQDAELSGASKKV
jgi:hypothetical protein